MLYISLEQLNIERKMKKIILILILLCTTVINSQNLVGKKYVAYLGNKCGGNFSSFFYTELDFKINKVIETNYLLQDIGDINKRQLTKFNEYDYKIENKYLIIIGSKYEKIEILKDQLKTPSLTFKIINDNQINKVSYYGQSGGKDGSYTNFEMTKDSVICYVGAHYPLYKDIYKEETNKEFWRKTTQNIDINEFKKIRSTKSKLSYDGYDEFYTIEINKVKYEILNALISNNENKNILESVNLLKDKISKFKQISNKKLTDKIIQENLTKKKKK